MNESRTSIGSEVHRAFARHLELLDAGRPSDLETWKASNPEHAESVAKLERDWQLVTGLLGGRAQAPTTPASMFGDFELIALLGSGGMGEVWRARQISLARPVALKLLHVGRLTQPDALARFEREARAGARLEHPGVVRIHAFGEHQGRHYIAQELVHPARTLRDWIDARRDAVERGEDDFDGLANLFVDIADALQAAHDAGIVHRDVKPQNILIDARGSPKVADFGLARVVDDADLSRSGDVAGTFCYMSPEQVRGSRDVDARSDVFSLGATLFEALALQRAFDGDSSHQVAARVLHHDVPDVRTLRDRVPFELAVISMKSLEKSPDLRYATMRALADDLRRFLAREPIHARPTAASRRAVRWVQRHPLASTVLGTSFATVAVISVLAWKLDARTREADRAQIAEAARAREAELKTQQVLRLSAIQDVARLQTDVESLRPIGPELVSRAEAWLARADEVLTRRAGFEGDLAQLRARGTHTVAPHDHPAAVELARKSKHLGAVRLALAQREGRAPKPAVVALVDASVADASAKDLVQRAQPWLNPYRVVHGRESEGLALCELAVERASTEEERIESWNAKSYALAALGRDDEALEAGRRSVEVASEEHRGPAEDAFLALSVIVDHERSLAGRRARAAESARLQQDCDELVARLAVDAEWSFDDPGDRWWHAQLVELLQGLSALGSTEYGVRAGSPRTSGASVAARLQLSRELHARSLESYAARWHDAIETIADPSRAPRYAGLRIAPQLGLVPLGPDPESGLWEFAHVLSGTIPDRGPEGRLLLDDRSCIVLVLLPGGETTVGSQKTDPRAPYYHDRALAQEARLQKVRLDPFFLAKHETSQGQWMQVAVTNPSSYATPRRPAGQFVHLRNPVELVHRDQALEWLVLCALDLPTEAQWEYGARAETTTLWWTGGERESLRGAVNLADSSAARNGNPWPETKDWPDHDDGFPIHAPVDSFRANPFGLHNVHGNVWEWVRDAGTTVAKLRDGDGLASASLEAICRGGGFSQSAEMCRSAYRYRRSGQSRSDNLGFRAARSLTP